MAKIVICWYDLSIIHIDWRQNVDFSFDADIVHWAYSFFSMSFYAKSL